ncbi:hypothetical protein HK100_010809 [Physocladia obscura]|uniref:SDR family NAD(P)-dependent oxidoreductase n=1 Tax=Physocladia obscura TaxID=109957 RepID=A0AAD5XI00_9FUNG|nr:hypothetical protein HK100_010809 [Physocladia obscura]
MVGQVLSKILTFASSNGIGFAITRRITHGGNKVVIIGRRQQVLGDTVAELSAKGLKVESFRGHATTPSERVALFSEITTQYPEASVLTNFTGIMKRVDILGDEPWESVLTDLDINLREFIITV